MSRTRAYPLAFIAAVAVLLLWWILSAGATTVGRIVLYNWSGIDDDKIFPQRRLKASAAPFRFLETDTVSIPNPSRGSNNRNDLPLEVLLDQNDTIAFLIAKGDVIVFEKYYQGYNRSRPSLAFSVSKSVLSLLLGAAIDDGYIQSVQQPVTHFVPEMGGRGFGSVTLQHLLQMTSGIDYSENDNPFGIHARFYYTDHLEEEILRLSLRDQPGRRFEYRSSDALLLGLILQRALGGKTITQYTQDRLWTPLGMENDGGWSIDHAPDGLEKTSCCLSITARDLAKIGALYLNEGKRAGQQIVSKSWVQLLTTPDTAASSSLLYQYLWWRIPEGGNDFLAQGHLGQYLYVSPDQHVVIVRLGRSLGQMSHEEWVRLLRNLAPGFSR